MTAFAKNSTVRRVLPLSLALASLALVAACGGSSSDNSGGSAAAGSSSSSSAASSHNAADVAFATDMIPHHAQAVEMADMALARGTDTEVKTLARDIKGAQAPEISTMSGWLTSWNAPVPMTGMSHSTSGRAGTGMMSADDMASLDKASGIAFDRMWLDMMTRHHTGAIDMAKSELGRGQSADAKVLARQIVASQTAQVATMAAAAKRLS